ncbi:uncharacterized protein LOC132717930 [Ruditapes philippinarum]|uniref:uncharacterized protein LOC132717930 n=1 Tax=Ruditapes philippinarum TaxID=129788 RepID=UPI00295BADB4|nr:uncharacterized protein LOC132717930 [Ruditapes philippinarum]
MKAPQLADLGSSQQCEHANREVTMRAPKSLHYGNSESLDFRVKATAAFINEGASLHFKAVPVQHCYYSRNKMLTGDDHKVHSEAGLSPGVHSLRYADKCQKHRKRVQERSALPSTKRRRLQLKQERSITQGAQEALEGMSYQSEIGHSDDADIQKLPRSSPSR